MNVILLSGMWPRPGLPEAGVFVLEQAKALRDAGCSIQVISPVPWAPRVLWFRRKWRLYAEASRVEQMDNLRVIRPRYVRPPGRLPIRLDAAMMHLGVTTLLQDLTGVAKQPAVLHAHRLLPEGWVAAQLKRRLGYPFVVTGHGGDVYKVAQQKRGRQLARQVLLAADAVVGVSRYIADIMVKLGASSVHVIPNGYDAGAFPSSISPRFGQRIVYVGRLDARKGVIDLLQAFARVKREVPLASLTYVGDGPARLQLEHIVAQTHIRDVIVMGRQPHSRIPAILQEHDVFVLPSYAEGMPTALVEAMASGLAVVAAAAGGIPEVIAHGKTGLLVSPGHVGELADSLRVLLSDGALQMRLRKCAHDAVADRYSWRTIAKKLMELYRRVMGPPIPQALSLSPDQSVQIARMENYCDAPGLPDRVHHSASPNEGL